MSPTASADPAVPRPGLEWVAFATDFTTVWRDDIDRQWTYWTPTTLEVHFVPAPEQRLEVRRLAALQSELVSLGRNSGLFTAEEHVTGNQDERLVVVRTGGARFDHDEAGVVVTRQGQRGAWFTLPHDTMGSVFDAADLTPRVAAVISMLARVDAPLAPRLAPAIGLTSMRSLSVQSTAVVGRRDGQSYSAYYGRDLKLNTEDSIAARALADAPEDLAEELVARLEVALRKRR